MDSAGSHAEASVLTHLGRAYAGCDVIDLSVTLENGIPRWPSHPPLVVHPTLTHSHDGYFSNTLFLPEHIGTHCDAPAHVCPDRAEQTIDTLAVDLLVGPAAVIDLGPLNLEANETVGPEVIAAWEAQHGLIQPAEIVLMTFGWLARHWRTDAGWSYYSTNSPGLTDAAVRLLYERHIKALGTDLVACDQAMRDGVEQPSAAHERYLLPNGIPLIEELAHLEQLPPRCFFIALPLKIKGGSGSPLRAMALVPRTTRAHQE